MPPSSHGAPVTTEPKSTWKHATVGFFDDVEFTVGELDFELAWAVRYGLCCCSACYYCCAADRSSSFGGA